MNVEIEKYRTLAAKEAVLALDNDLPEDERKQHMDNSIRLNDIYTKLIQYEHDYNNPVRERKERSTDIIKTIGTSILQLLCYGGVAAIFGYVDTHDRLPGAVLKDTMKKVSFRK